MIDFKKSELPQAVKVGGSFFDIHTDHRYILIFRDKLKEAPKDLREFDFMYIDKKPDNRLDGINAICEFMTPPQELPRRTTNEIDEVVLDYEIDAPYIYAAFMEQYKIDLIETPLHWHKFLALLHALHDTELNRIINCRMWKPNGKNGEYERMQQKLYEAWRLPQPDENEKDDDLAAFENNL